MNQTHPKAPLGIFSLLIFIGIGAIVFAFWLIDHRQAIPNSGIIIMMSVGFFFVSFTTAFLLYLRWRDSRRTMSVSIIPSTILSQQGLDGTIYGMVPGSKYRIVKSFSDFYGNPFQQGEVLQFKERHFHPYYGGHTIFFDGRTLYLQEEKNDGILECFSEYLVQVAE